MEEAQDIKYVDGIKLCRESLLRMNRSKQESNSSTSSSSSAETGDIDDSNGKDLVLSQQPQSAVVLEFPKQ